MIHFELIFAYGAKYDQFLLLVWGVFCTEVFKFSNTICPTGHVGSYLSQQEWTLSPSIGSRVLTTGPPEKSPHSVGFWVWHKIGMGRVGVEVAGNKPF